MPGLWKRRRDVRRGSLFEAAMEIKGAVDSARDEDGMIGKAARKLGEKVGFSKKRTKPPKKAVMTRAASSPLRETRPQRS